MDGAKNAFRIIMCVTFLASLVGAFGVISQASEMSGMGIPIGAMLTGACLQLLQVATVWIPAEVLFDLHSKATSGGCSRSK